MGVEPPFMYDKPSTYTFAGPTNRGFNPKAVTRASWTPPAPRPKQEGPLIDFNKHPDSYLIVPYGNLNVEPMSPKTKNRVKRTRKAQLVLRILTLLASVGLLFCIIAINKTSTTVGWVIRIGPAVTLCHCIYAIYHLCRDASSRSPASSASYMLFAAMLDTSLIPFYAFSAVMANADYTTNAYDWSTLFNDNDVSYKIIYAFFLACVIEGGFLLTSLLVDVYLAVVFRKIAKLPPDMNPLEDNLTARPNGKHKRNKSELNFEKHLSGSTLATQRMSQASNPSPTNFKRVPFVHTRTDSADSITLYGNDKALNSRVSLRNGIKEAGADPYRNSMASSRDTLIPARPGSAVTPAANARLPGAGLEHKPVRSSGLAQSEQKKKTSWLSYMDYEGVPTNLSPQASRALDEEVRPISPVSMISERDFAQERAQVERHNWYQGSPRNSAFVNGQAQFSLAHDNVSAESLHQAEQENNAMLQPLYQSKKRSRDPLGMNPPTPVRDRFQDENIYRQTTPEPDFRPQQFSTPQPQRPILHEVQQPMSTPRRPATGSRPSSFVGSGGKSRYYGDLRNSLGGSPTHESFDSPLAAAFYTPSQKAQIHHIDDEDGSASMYSQKRTRTMQSSDSGNFKVYDSGDEEDYNSGNDDDDDEDAERHRQYHHNEMHYNHLKQQQATADIEAIMLTVPPTDAAVPETLTQDQEDNYEYDHDHDYDQHHDQHLPIPTHQSTDWNGARKVSNSTSHDLRTGYAGLGAEFGRGMARRREVSGKVAEEGRSVGPILVSSSGGGGGQAKGMGAAGWKRFHGL